MSNADRRIALVANLIAQHHLCKVMWYVAITGCVCVYDVSETEQPITLFRWHLQLEREKESLYFAFFSENTDHEGPDGV